ncbi:hypothetical protein [Bradyrhizobium sp. CCGB20]|uniref:hypothetical protein n=1 Tax=Bradyrhizobium sp. CCGB20 TaxID=2949633 RepID=UPI0020B44AA1|nr:hypothetical protein [Bradyrhizobium sp. CCGB20]MCP3400592.1 hypothetical protein [Bradyrhizobium sp. CCGB20]
MPIFVHIADERMANSIRRSGVNLSRSKIAETDIRKFGIFAMPVTSDFIVTHQWLREMKRRGFRSAVGVYFRIPDSELVWCGRYTDSKKMVCAAVAADWLLRERVMGFETVIPRSIGSAEIVAIRALPQTVGWRFYPEAKGQRPFCGCKYCVGGQIKSRRLRRQ